MYFQKYKTRCIGIKKTYIVYITHIQCRGEGFKRSLLLYPNLKYNSCYSKNYQQV